MIFGVFRDDHPRLTLSLPSASGEEFIEFIINTGFAGDLALPLSILVRLEADAVGIDSFALADGSQLDCYVYAMRLDWNGQPRQVEVLALDGEPLLGTRLLRQMLLQAEMVDGGEVEIGPI